MSNLVFTTIQEQAATLRARRASSVEVLEAHLAQIAKHNPKINAIVTLDEERARKRAREADAALARGESWGPLHGVPITRPRASARRPAFLPWQATSPPPTQPS